MLRNKNEMTSLEVLKQINFFREQEGDRAILTHGDFLKTIRDEFEEEIELGKISTGEYISNNNQKHPMFILTLSQSKQILMRESKFVRKAMIQYIEKLEQQLSEISSKDKLLIGLFSKDPTVVANSHKALVELETKPLVEKIEQDKPLVEFAEQVSTTTDCLLIREFCKVIADEKILIGEKKLYQWFRDKGFVMQNATEPTQKAINQGLFEVLERVVKTAYGNKITLTTKVTGKGQIYFVEKLRKEFTN